MACVLPLSYANHTFSVAISSTGFLLQSTVSFLFPSVWASSASNVNFKWTMIHIPDGWISQSIWWIYCWRVIHNFCLRSMVQLRWLDRINPLCLIHRSSLPEDIAFDAKDSLPRLQSLHRCTLAALTDTSTDTFCLSLFKCGIRGFDFWYLWMSLFGTGGLSNVFSIQVLWVVLRIKMKRFKMEVCRTWNKIPGVVAKNNNQIERSYGSFQLLPPESWQIVLFIRLCDYFFQSCWFPVQ